MSQHRAVNLQTGKAGSPGARIGGDTAGPVPGNSPTTEEVRHNRRQAAGQARAVPGQSGGKPETGRAPEHNKRQRMRSIAIALALGGLVVLFYLATIVRLGGNVFNRAL